MVARTDTKASTTRNTPGTLSEAIDKCVQNGHTLRDIANDDWKAHGTPGIMAQCSECLAYLRIYKGKPMGEAYSTSCRENPTLPQTVFGISVVEDDTIPKNTIVLASEIERVNMFNKPYHGYTLNDWAREIHQYACDKGWWDENENRSRNFGDLIALLHTELSEAYEEYRNGHSIGDRYYNTDRPVVKPDGTALQKPEGIPSELADVMIRLFDLFGYYGIDIESVLIEKHTYNLYRPYRHGNKVS